jgi:hypothetical protein
MAYEFPEHQKLGAIVAGICKAPRWDECWCDKKKTHHQSSGCRWCETYQLYWGLGPTCGSSGKPEKEYYSMGQYCTRTNKELQRLLDLQEKMHKKYKH